MQVHQIETAEDFESLREPWEAAHREDPHASVFTSWGWLRGWIGATSSPWVVLAAVPRRRAEPVAFLPIRSRPGRGPLQFRHPARLHPAGSPVADQASLVCAPEHERTALPALAAATARVMQNTGATAFHIDEAADRRWNTLLSLLGRRFALKRTSPTPSPMVPLPPTWKAYIGGSKKRKAALQRAEDEGFLVTHVDRNTLQRDIEIFLELHQLRLGLKPPSYLDLMRSLVEWTFRSGNLHMVILWSGDGRPMASNVAFVDPPKGTFHAYNGGWDAWFRHHSPRRVAELHSIRWAIEEGYRTYDLGRGDEGYKFGLGAEQRFNDNLVVQDRAPMAAARRLVSQVPGAFGLDDGRPAPDSATSSGAG